MAKKAAAAKSIKKGKKTSSPKLPGKKSLQTKQVAPVETIKITDYQLVLISRTKQGKVTGRNDDVRSFVRLIAPSGYVFNKDFRKNKIKHTAGSAYHWKCTAEDGPVDGTWLIVRLNVKGRDDLRRPHFSGADSLELTVTVPSDTTGNPDTLMVASISAWAGDYDPVGDFVGDP